MSFIQCKDKSEVEKVLKGRTHAFVTEDFRIYNSLDIWDDALSYPMDSETAMALLDLKLNITMLGEDGWETHFTKLVEDAEMLKASYGKVAEILKRRGTNGP